MRSMKVSVQVSVEGAASVERHIVEFYESGENDAIYTARVDRFGNLQKLSIDKIGFEGFSSMFEQFISRTRLDLKRALDRFHRGDQNGRSMLLITEDHASAEAARAVLFRFFAADGEVKYEEVLTPETDLERKKRRKLQAQKRIEMALVAKRRGVQPPVICETDDREFMDRLCKSYINLGW
ncbi:hypothetical protein [Pseudomonas retamae]|uniref:Uncharacterized protein n=1 Tax=Pseudomonas retamae TaxID=702110 RepID=A0ABW7DAK2_9PSED